MIDPRDFVEYVKQLTPAQAGKKLQILRELDAELVNLPKKWREALGFDAHWMDAANYEHYLEKRSKE